MCANISRWNELQRWITMYRRNLLRRNTCMYMYMYTTKFRLLRPSSHSFGWVRSIVHALIIWQLSSRSPILSRRPDLMLAENPPERKYIYRVRYFLEPQYYVSLYCIQNSPLENKRLETNSEIYTYTCINTYIKYSWIFHTWRISHIACSAYLISIPNVHFNELALIFFNRSHLTVLCYFTFFFLFF